MSIFSIALGPKVFGQCAVALPLPTVTVGFSDDAIEVETLTAEVLQHF